MRMKYVDTDVSRRRRLIVDGYGSPQRGNRVVASGSLLGTQRQTRICCMDVDDGTQKFHTRQCKMPITTTMAFIITLMQLIGERIECNHHCRMK